MDFLGKLSPFVHWGLRLSLAATFIYHGLGKVPVDQWAQNFGMNVVLAWLVTLAEIVAGIGLIAGGVSKDALTRLGGLLVIVIMVGAIYMVHLKNGWNVMNGGMEFQVLMLATGLYFLVKGNTA